MVRLLVVVAVLGSANARAVADAADSGDPFVVVVGVGGRYSWLTGPDPIVEHATLAASATLAARFVPPLAVGLHLARATSWSGGSQDLGNTTFHDKAWDVTSTDLAVAAAYETGRLVIAPWVGMHLVQMSVDSSDCGPRPGGMVTCSSSSSTTNAAHMSFGLTASVKIVRCVPVAVMLDVQSSRRGAVIDPYPAKPYRESALTLGVAYHR